jgi:hypothetical protein
MLGELFTGHYWFYTGFFPPQGFLIISLISSSAVPHAPIPSVWRASLSVGSGTIKPGTIVLPARLREADSSLPSLVSPSLDLRFQAPFLNF